jgi:hypothetical protein
VLAVIGAVSAAVLGFVDQARATTIGANDDTAKFMADGGAAYFRQMAAVGLTRVVLTVRFDPADPTRIADQDLLDPAVANAVAAGLQVAFTTYPYPPRELAAGRSSPAAFASWLALVAGRYPQVRQFVVMNEPNQPAFLRPQFIRGGLNASAATTGAYLAAAYDALKAVDPAITVIGVGLSPRGNDNPHAPNNVSTSPIRFLDALGRWYRESGRTAPLMDGFSYHPYPASSNDPLSKSYLWPTAGFADLARIKQALWDAFAGTGQPTTVDGLKLYLDEVGWQVDTTGEPGYSGIENVPVTNEATQAAIYGDLVRQSACDPAIASVSFFGFYDDGLRSGFQSGLYRADGTARPSAAAVQQAISDTDVAGCTGVPVAWSPAAGVAGAAARGATFDTGGGDVTYGAPLSLAVTASVVEGAAISAVLAHAGPRRSILSRLLQSTRAPVAVSATVEAGPVKRARLTLALPQGLPRGRYVVAVRFTAEANAQRTTVVLGRSFAVR